MKVGDVVVLKGSEEHVQMTVVGLVPSDWSGGCKGVECAWHAAGVPQQATYPVDALTPLVAWRKES